MHRDLRRLCLDIYDVAIIGGGIYGLFAAWDASLRGLSVALVEQRDFGHATSSNSLRIIHGGLRYLQHGNLRRMRRSIRERRTFMRIAPHLVHPLAFLIPTYGHTRRGRTALSLALLMGDLIAFDRNRLGDPAKHLPRGRIISRDECLRLLPDLEAKGLTGGAICYDSQMPNSERLILAVARSAALVGANLANYVEVIKFSRAGNRVTGFAAKDVLTGDALDIRARVVINASGPWLDRVLGYMNDHQPRTKLALSKAFNVLINRRLAPPYAVGVYSKSGRLLFITPWHGRSLIGTAHLPYAADPDHVGPTEEEIQGFLGEINAAHPGAGLKLQDVCRIYSGLLPMAGASRGTGDVRLVTQHRVLDHRYEGVEGLVSIVGVKFTEVRYVAEKAVDLVFSKLGRRPPESRTAVTPLYGGHIERLDDFLAQAVRRPPHELSAQAVRQLIYRHGSAYAEVLKYLEADRRSAAVTVTTSGAEQAPALWFKHRDERPLMSSPPWATQWEDEVSWPADVSLAHSDPLLRAEVLHGVRQEMAQTLADVVCRRIAWEGISGPGEAWLKTCALIMAHELGWDSRRIEREVEEVKKLFSERS